MAAGIYRQQGNWITASPRRHEGWFTLKCRLNFEKAVLELGARKNLFFVLQPPDSEFGLRYLGGAELAIMRVQFSRIYRFVPAPG